MDCCNNNTQQWGSESGVDCCRDRSSQSLGWEGGEWEGVRGVGHGSEG